MLCSEKLPDVLSANFYAVLGHSHDGNLVTTDRQFDESASFFIIVKVMEKSKLLRYFYCAVSEFVKILAR